MTREQFQQLVAEEFPKALKQKFIAQLKNVALLVEDEPSHDVRRTEGLLDGETLLGYYVGFPNTVRGSEYGVGPTLPDTITLYQLPIEEEALRVGGGEEAVRRVIRETLWHEVAHYFGMEEHEVRAREAK